MARFPAPYKKLREFNAINKRFIRYGSRATHFHILRTGGVGERQDGKKKNPTRAPGRGGRGKEKGTCREEAAKNEKKGPKSEYKK